MQAEALHRQFRAKKDVLENQTKKSVVEKYGNAAKAPDSEEQQLLLGQTEGYVEYNAAGRVIKGQESKVKVCGQDIRKSGVEKFCFCILWPLNQSMCVGAA